MFQGHQKGVVAPVLPPCIQMAAGAPFIKKINQLRTRGTSFLRIHLRNTRDYSLNDCFQLRAQFMRAAGEIPKLWDFRERRLQQTGHELNGPVPVGRKA